MNIVVDADQSNSAKTTANSSGEWATKHRHLIINNTNSHDNNTPPNQIQPTTTTTATQHPPIQTTNNPITTPNLQTTTTPPPPPISCNFENTASTPKDFHSEHKMEAYKADHVAVRFVLECENSDFDNNFVPITDSFVVMPSNTRVCGLIPEVVNKLKLTNDHRVTNCRSYGCFIVLKNWKPINVEFICDVNETSLMQLVGHFPNFAVIKIRFFRNITPLHQTRNQVLMLLAQAQSLIRNVDLLADNERSSSNSRNPLILPPLLRDRFMHTGNYVLGNASNPPADVLNLTMRDRTASGRPVATAAGQSHQHPHQFNTSILAGTKRSSNYTTTHHSTTAAVDNCAGDGTDTVNYVGIKRVRERITFDSSTEVPILMSAFERNRHPTREDIDALLQELNANRKGKRPLEVFNIQYWFKNARAMDKKRRFSLKPEGVDVNEDEDEVEGSSPVTALPVQTSTTANNLVNGIVIKEEAFEVDPTNNGGDSADVANLKRLEAEGLPPPHHQQQQQHHLISSHHHHHHFLHNNSQQLPIQISNADDFVAVCQPSMTAANTNTNGAGGGCNTNESPIGDMSTDNGSTDEQINSSQAQRDEQLNRPNSEYPFHASCDVNAILDRSSSYHRVNNTNFAYLPQITQPNAGTGSEKQKRRNRVFIDPTTEIPVLERWFSTETHPSQALIKSICDEMNRGPYRSQYQKLKPRNVQLWFKNHRAKLKRSSRPENAMSTTAQQMPTTSVGSNSTPAAAAATIAATASTIPNTTTATAVINNIGIAAAIKQSASIMLTSSSTITQTAPVDRHIPEEKSALPSQELLNFDSAEKTNGKQKRGEQ